MTTKRNRHERGKGATSQAFGLTKGSLLCYRPWSHQPNGSVTRWELLSKWEKRLKLSRSNTVHMLEACRRWLCIKKSRHIYYVSPVIECAEIIEFYILYDRKNHPAKKGKNRLLTGSSELEAVNKVLYPSGINIFKI